MSEENGHTKKGNSLFFYKRNENFIGKGNKDTKK